MKRSVRLVTAVVLTFAGLSSATPAGADEESSGARYYLALGDSVAQGFQPDTPNAYYTKDGYAWLVQDGLAGPSDKLRLENLGCGGETARSMVAGSQVPSVTGYGSCGDESAYWKLFKGATQLDAAADFLAANAAYTELVTLDIGANDLLRCLQLSDPFGCVQTRVPQLAADLDTILDGLQAAAPDVEIVGMNYYNPFACRGQSDPVAQATDALVGVLNGTLEQVYAAHGVPVADVAATFHVGEYPLAAELASEWTWMCTANDIHPTDAGHEAIADTFLATID
jgi:lysophospholipase L1-like esterase